MKQIFLIGFLFIFLPSVVAQEAVTVFFDSNKYELNTTETNKLNVWIAQNKSSKIVAIHGFTDEDGSTGYNDTLAQKRVATIFSKVKNQIKIREDYKSISVGERFVQSKKKEDNRKVVIYYILEKDILREEELLGIKKMEPTQIVPKPKIDYPSTMVFTNPNGSTTEYKLDTNFMQKVSEAKAGEKLKIDNLNFIINTFIVEPKSKGKLYELLLVLQNNPSMKIEIQGHLCCMPTDRTDLSTQRAKAVYNFLVANDIYRGQLSYKGFGSTQPIYPLPEKNEEERAANRRVEILILNN